IDTTRTSYDNLNGGNLLKKYLLHAHVGTVENFENIIKKEWIFSSVDAGGKEFAARFTKTFLTPLLVVDKRRNSLTNNIDEITILKPQDLSLEGKTVFIVDDMIDSGGSIVDVCRKYKELGAKEVNVAVFFGLFSSPAEERLNLLVKEGILNKLIVTDLVKLDDDFYKRNPYIEIVDTSYTTSRVIQRTNQGRSLEKYFAPFDAVEYLKTKVEPERGKNYV
ncbi:MAG TPA: phosphoribosyltransferase family protein, partial [Spirochaetota bacterium]|nr:phosphoribosyltransferase family protein [Spirochaetota bacterium]